MGNVTSSVYGTASHRKNVDLNSCQMRARRLPLRLAAHHRLLRHAQRRQRGQHHHRRNNPAQRSKAHPIGQRHQQKNRQSAKGQRPALVEAAGTPPVLLALQRAHDAAAGRHHQPAEADRHKHQPHAPRRSSRAWWNAASSVNPAAVAASISQVRRRTQKSVTGPHKKIDRMRQNQQRKN